MDTESEQEEEEEEEEEDKKKKKKQNVQRKARKIQENKRATQSN